GLDIREYLANHSDVSKVLQIAPPNAGTPLADFFSFGDKTALERSVNNWVKVHTEAPWRELTTANMAQYNESHPLQFAKVHVTAVAGVYTPDPLVLGVGDAVLNWRGKVVGIGDGCVPEWSVQSLGNIGSYEVSSGGSDFTALHENQPSEPFF